MGIVADAFSDPDFRYFIEIGPGMHYKTLAHLLIDMTAVSMDDRSDTGIRFVGRLRQVNIVDPWF
ncbi:hypothetical protein NX79_00690 [Xanthomonas vasicola]|nr:hypothetical protein NX79_00690 [Xanthomonas vasicola]